MISSLKASGNKIPIIPSHARIGDLWPKDKIKSKKINAVNFFLINKELTLDLLLLLTLQKRFHFNLEY